VSVHGDPDAAGPSSTGDPDASATRRQHLLGLKLRALVREHTGADAEVVGFAPGAAMVVDDHAWVLLDDEADRQPGRHLGSALAWSLRRGAAALHLIADTDSGLLARRAAAFSFPIEVWRSDGRRLVAASADRLGEPPAPDPAHLALRELIVAGGATPVVEHGVVVGEVRGLEVCRVVADPTDGRVRLEVGVGRHDREMFQLVHGDVPTVEALAGVVDAVLRHRDLSAPQHPLNRLAGERFLRWRLQQTPGLVGARTLDAMEPPVPRANVLDPVPCVAAGVDDDGEPLVVVCSTGVDLDLVPFTADAQADDVRRHGRTARTVIAVPVRDRLGVTVELAGLVSRPVDVVPIDESSSA
jgi:hypothetical protein